MRVTAEAKVATRGKILEVAAQLFRRNGFEVTTTRDIAREAEIAHGTLFNYFTNKESILACLANEALGVAIVEFRADTAANRSLEEDLFALIAVTLRKLKPIRKHLPALIETLLSPLSQSRTDDCATFRLQQLEVVAQIATRHQHRELPSIALQLYWTLLTGIFVFWANDKSPKQEDSLALIDQSLNMFVNWLADSSES